MKTIHSHLDLWVGSGYFGNSLAQYIAAVCKKKKIKSEYCTLKAHVTSLHPQRMEIQVRNYHFPHSSDGKMRQGATAAPMDLFVCHCH